MKTKTFIATITIYIIISAFSFFYINGEIGKWWLNARKTSDVIVLGLDTSLGKEKNETISWLFDNTIHKDLKVINSFPEKDIIFSTEFIYKGPTIYVLSDGSVLIRPNPSEVRGEAYSPTYWYYKRVNGNIYFTTESDNEIAQAVKNWSQ